MTIRTILLSIFSLALAFGLSAKKSTGQSPSTPDFAYPQTVEKNANIDLQRALDRHDWKNAAIASVKSVTAADMISRENVIAGLARLDSIRNVAPEEWKPAFALIQTDIYSEIYKSSRWQMDSRQLPLDTFPENPFDWSRDLFALKVLQLLTPVVDAAPDFTNSLSDWKTLLKDSDYALRIGMTVGEFLNYRSFQLLSLFSDASQDIIPFFPADSSPSTPTQKCAALREKAIDMLLQQSAADKRQSLLLARAYVMKSDILPDFKKAGALCSALDILKDKEGEQPILLAIGDYIDDTSDSDNQIPLSKDGYIRALRKSIAEFPKAPYANALRNRLEDLTRPYVKVDIMGQVLSSDTVNAEITMGNCSKSWLLVFDYSPFADSDSRPATSEIVARCKLVKSVPIETKSDSQESSFRTQLGTFNPGSYVVIPSATSSASGIYKTLEKENWYKAFSVSDITYMSMKCPDAGTRVFIVDALTGRPLEGAVVKVYTDSGTGFGKSLKLTSTLTTNSDGYVEISEKRFEFKAEYNDSRCDSRYMMSNYSYRQDSEDVINATLLTDRSIYHPGDTVKAVVVGYVSSRYDVDLCPGKTLDIKLINASRKEVDSATVTLDADARATVSFRLPESGMLGRWSLSASSDKGRNAGSSGFEVADYVAPSFFITLADEKSQLNSGDTAIISGEVKTYSGMPLSGADVKYSVTYQPFGRWYSWSGATYDSSVATDAEGKFKIELPTSNLKDTGFRTGVFSVRLSATSMAGETQEGPTARFALGNRFTIAPETSSERYEVSENLPRLVFNVRDALGNKVEKSVTYTVVNPLTNDTVAKGTFESPILELPSADWKSALYRVDVALADDPGVNSDMQVTLWRKSDTAAPQGVGLWLPEKKVVASPGQTVVSVAVGQGNTDRWIPAVLSGPDSLMSVKWLYVERDNVSVDVPVPPSGSHYELSCNSVSALQPQFGNVKVYPADADSRLAIKTVSFRDRLTADEREHWSMLFSKSDLPAANIPVMAVMTDAALNSLAPFSWSFEPSPRIVPSFCSMSVNSIWSSPRRSWLASAKYNKFSAPVYPAIDDFNRNWGLAAIYDMQKFAAMDAVPIVRESSEGETEYIRGQGAMLASAPRMNMAMKSMADTGGVEYQADDMAEITSESVESNGTAASETSDLRQSECPVAFFMPLLSTDNDGIVSIDFTVPNFNTTWNVQILGYDKELQTAKTTLEAVASKPVMVRLNAPRFLRTGDKVSLTATLFNNSANRNPLGGRIEILDPLSGKLIASSDFRPEDVAGMASRVVTMQWTAPSGISQIAVRAYAEGNSHRDGEQVLVPVLPASSPVVESTPFWFAPGQVKFEAKLPKFKDSDRVTLQYCDNPAWYCVSALPDITVPASTSILTRMQALFGNAVAHHLISSNPSLKKGLEFMLSDQNSEFATLKSNLQKDGNLKIADIDNTPWINSAESETLRMSRLSTLLSDSIANATINSLLDEIRQRQSSAGGWSWCPDMSVSEWMTREVVRYFALISKAGALDMQGSDLEMIKRAISFVDSSEVESYKKYHKKGDSAAYLLDWLYIRSFFPESMLTSGTDAKAFAEISAKALSDIESAWKDLSIDSKAKAAITLWRNGNRKTASLILESLRQFASESPEKGAWFDNLGSPDLMTTSRVLDAFAEIEPQNRMVDLLRQYLVLSRQTQDWGANSCTAEVVNAIMTSGTDWTRTASTPKFRLGGKTLEVPKQASMTGAFTLSLDSKKASGSTLKIERDGASPAWGGVIAQYEAPLADIKAADIPDLSISKQIVALVPNADGSLTPSSGISLSKGMRVRVTLTIDAGRDMDYVAVTDERSACLEPASQISSYTSSDGLWFYREVRNEVTNLFIDRLPKGHHVISYDCWVTLPGDYSCGIATAQSQYAPTEVAHSAPVILTVE